MNKKLDKCDYVSFETAKALKDAGFEQSTKCGYTKDGKFLEYRADFAAPHLWTAMKWLREERKLMIDVYLWHIGYDIAVCHFDKPTMDLLKGLCGKIPTYEQACDQGIKAACEWLIQQKGGKS